MYLERTASGSMSAEPMVAAPQAGATARLEFGAACGPNGSVNLMGASGQGIQQARLANPGWAEHGEGPAPALQRARERARQTFELGLALEQPLDPRCTVHPFARVGPRIGSFPQPLPFRIGVVVRTYPGRGSARGEWVDRARRARHGFRIVVPMREPGRARLAKCPRAQPRVLSRGGIGSRWLVATA